MNNKFSNLNRIFFIGFLFLICLLFLSTVNPKKNYSLPGKKNIPQVQKYENIKPSTSQGTVNSITFYSRSLKKEQNVQVYLPEVIKKLLKNSK